MTNTILFVQTSEGTLRLRKKDNWYIVDSDSISRMFETYSKAKKFFNKLLNKL